MRTATVVSSGHWLPSSVGLSTAAESCGSDRSTLIATTLLVEIVGFWSGRMLLA